MKFYCLESLKIFVVVVVDNLWKHISTILQSHGKADDLPNWIQNLMNSSWRHNMMTSLESRLKKIIYLDMRTFIILLVVMAR